MLWYSVDKFTMTLRGVLAEFYARGDRTVFWDEATQKNIDPFTQQDASVFSAPWDIKVRAPHPSILALWSSLECDANLRARHTAQSTPHPR